MDSIKELDVVALLVDFPQQGLRRGDVGTIVQSFDANEHHPGGYLVEFLDEDNNVWIEADITDQSQIIPLNFKRKAA
jgi:hypothetical protein